jgi:hypothetical protein
MIYCIVGHGRSPEGRGWSHEIDACDVVIRMWDCAWQPPADYGTKYDFGLFEVHPTMMRTFSQFRRREPTQGWIGSVLHQPQRCRLPDRTQLVDQERWSRLGMQMGGVGRTGRLQFTRGTIASLWAIERARRGDTVVLLGFDNIRLGQTLALELAFCESYRANPGTFSFSAYRGGETKHGNHDFAIEYPLMRKIAQRRGVKLRFAEDMW